MRESNIELLRIVSMVLIIMHHFSVHGTFAFTPDLTFNKVFLLVFGLGLFIMFLKAKITYRPWINTVASTTFGIYLLHDNKLFLHQSRVEKKLKF